MDNNGLMMNYSLQQNNFTSNLIKTKNSLIKCSNAIPKFFKNNISKRRRRLRPNEAIPTSDFKSSFHQSPNLNEFTRPTSSSIEDLLFSSEHIPPEFNKLKPTEYYTQKQITTEYKSKEQIPTEGLSREQISSESISAKHILIEQNNVVLKTITDFQDDSSPPPPPPLALLIKRNIPQQSCIVRNELLNEVCEKTQNCKFLRLPTDILIQIFSFLNGSDLVHQIQYVCQQLLCIGRADSLWHAICLREMPKLLRHNTEALPWETVFRSRRDKSKVEKYKNELLPIQEMYLEMEAALECLNRKYHNNNYSNDNSDIQIKNLLNSWHASNPNNPTPKLKNDNHVCNPKACKFDSVSDSIFICNKTGQVHICSDKTICTQALISDADTTALVCSISGRVFTPKFKKLKESGVSDTMSQFYDDLIASNRQCEESDFEIMESQAAWIRNCENIVEPSRHGNGDDDFVCGFFGSCYSRGYDCLTEQEFFDDSSCMEEVSQPEVERPQNTNGATQRCFNGNRRSNSWYNWRESDSEDLSQIASRSTPDIREKMDAQNLVLVPGITERFEEDDELENKRQYSTSSSFEVESMQFTWKEILKFIGPGWLVAMAYVDPGNLEGDLVAGALRSANDSEAGYRLLWVLLWATLIGFGLQRLAIRLGTVTNKDLATLCHLEFSRPISFIIWIFTELCLIGADVQAVIGSAIGLKLLFNLPIFIGIFLTLIDAFIILLVDFFGTRKLEATFAFMITLMAGCFFANMFTSKPNVTSIIKGLVLISIPEGSLPFTIALIGSVIMPHNLFLQSAVVQSRSIDRKNSNYLTRVLRLYSIETFCLLMISLIVNISVVVAFANPKIIHNQNLNLYNAHIALKSVIGEKSALIWGLGLLAAGQCSTMACTYAGQFIMEGLLGLRIKKLWLRVLVTRFISIIPLLFLIKMKKGTVEIIANCVNVMQAFNLPFTLILLLKFTASEKVMGKYKLSNLSKLFAYISGCFLILANVNLVIFQLGGISIFVCLILLIYFLSLGFLWWKPLQSNYFDLSKSISLLHQK